MSGAPPDARRMPRPAGEDAGLRDDGGIEARVSLNK